MTTATATADALATLLRCHADLLAARYHLTTVNAAALDNPTAQAFRDVDAAVILVATEIDRARTAYLAYGVTAGLVEDAGRVGP